MNKVIIWVITVFLIALTITVIWAASVDEKVALGVSAACAAILALVAIWNIYIVNNREKRDKDEKQVEKVIEWAENIINCGDAETSNISEQDFGKFTDLQLRNLYYGYKTLYGKHWQIMKIIASLKDTHLNNSVNTTVDRLEQCQEILENGIKGGNFDARFIAIRREMEEYAVAVIERSSELISDL